MRGSRCEERGGRERTIILCPEREISSPHIILCHEPNDRPRDVIRRRRGWTQAYPCADQPAKSQVSVTVLVTFLICVWQHMREKPRKETRAEGEGGRAEKQNTQEKQEARDCQRDRSDCKRGSGARACVSPCVLPPIAFSFQSLRRPGKERGYSRDADLEKTFNPGIFQEGAKLVMKIGLWIVDCEVSRIGWRVVARVEMGNGRR